MNIKKIFMDYYDLIIGFNAETDILAIGKQRVNILIFGFSIFFLVIIFRMFDLAIGVDYDKSHHKAYFSTESEMFERADIVDRNGIILATNLPTSSLYANPKNIIDKEDCIKKLAKVFPEIGHQNLKEKIYSDKRFVWIRRNLTPKEQVEVNALGLPGIMFYAEQKRVYPHENLFAHMLGYTDIDGKGISGIERSFDNYLRSKDNYNKPLILSVDARIQNIVREELNKYIKTFKAQGGVSIVMDARNGEIISMVSLPDFDLNDPKDASDKQKFNQATLGIYEMGSTFKPFTIAMGFDSGTISMEDKYDVSKPFQAANFTITDYTKSKKDSLTIPEIMMYSSNIGIANIAMDLGTDIQKYFLENFGFFDKVKIELEEKSKPLYPKKWSDVNTVTIGYGHGIAVSPIHMVQAFAPMVNGGVLYNPTLLKVEDVDKLETRSVISKATSDKIKQLLRLVVEKGTGKKADAKGYMIGGKTGSAEKSHAGGYNKKEIFASFLGSFPIHDPQYVIITLLDAPKGNESTYFRATGGYTAAPLAKDIVQKIGSILNVMPVDENSDIIQKQFWVDYKDKEKEFAAK